MVEVTENKGVVTVTLSETDRITVVNVNELKNVLTTHLRRDVEKVVLNLAPIKFMDSTGISVLISSLKVSRENNHEFAITNVQAEVMKLFVLMKLDKIFTIE